MKINIIGDGIFGNFLKKLFLSTDVELTPDADIVILAVPFDAYDEVAGQHKGKVLVNVCSVQEETNAICRKHSDDVIGIHPMFGKNSLKTRARVCLVTHGASTAAGILSETELYHVLAMLNITCIFKTPEGDYITGAWHDQLMADSHLPSLDIAEFAAPKLKRIQNTPDVYLTATSAMLRQLVNQLQDMPEGTRDSIRANKYV